MPKLDGTDDFFDSHDVIARLSEIKEEIADIRRMVKGSPPDDYVSEREDLADLKAERKALRALRDEAIGNHGNAAEWDGGMTFLADGYMPDYAEEYAYDIGAVSRDAEWPLGHLDWDAAAESLKEDYASYDFRGTTYWARAY